MHANSRFATRTLAYTQAKYSSHTHLFKLGATLVMMFLTSVSAAAAAALTAKAPATFDTITQSHEQLPNTHLFKLGATLVMMFLTSVSAAATAKAPATFDTITQSHEQLPNTHLFKLGATLVMMFPTFILTMNARQQPMQHQHPVNPTLTCSSWAPRWS
jgi:uncharacterized protein YqfB (UPF0267 family)